MIDHTHVFSIGTIWDENQLPRLTKKEFDVKNLNQFNYRNIIDSVKFDKKFYTEVNVFLEKIKNIKAEFVEKIISEIPEDWEISINEKKLLCNYIVSRFHRIDEIVELLNLKGGETCENES